MPSTTRGSILISTANDIGTTLVDKLGGTGYTPDEWDSAANLCGIASADIETAIENITESTPQGAERGSMSIAKANSIGAVLNKKFDTTRGFKPSEWASAISKLTPLEIKTASGAIAHIEDGADGVPVKNWLVTFPASLSGYTEVNGVRSGKNIVNVTFSDFNASNIISNAFSLKAGTYTLSLVYNGTPTWGIYLRDGSSINSPVLFNKYNDTSLTFTLSEDKETLCITMYYANGITSSEVSDIQIEVGSTPTQYSAYEAPTQYTASLGRTIYGGTADVVTGEGEDENGNAFTFTPITPTPETALGSNNFWSDEGDSEVTYRADIDLAQ